MSSPKGFPSNQKIDLGSGKTNEFTTVIPVDPFRRSLDVHSRFVFRVDSDSVPRVAGASTGVDLTANPRRFWVEDTATPAKIGDIVRFEDGDAQFIEFPICDVETDRFLISCLPGDLSPAAGDEFYILRHATQRVGEDGSQFVVLSPVIYNPVDLAVLDTSSDNVDDTNWVELIAATSDPIVEIEIFNKTGLLMELGIGAAASEQRLILFGSDGLSRQQVPIAVGSRISVRCLQSAVADQGLILLNTFG